MQAGLLALMTRAKANAISLRDQLLLDILNDATGSGGIVLGAGDNYIGHVGGTTSLAQNGFARPANVTAYAANDVVSDNEVLEIQDCARVSEGNGYVTMIKVVTNKTGLTPTLRVHFAKSSGVYTNIIDNAAAAMPYTDISDPDYIGFIELAAMRSDGLSASSITEDNTIRLPFELFGKTGSTSLFLLIETLEAFTPDSGQLFSVSLGVEQN